jgi:hypothetical protein
MSFSTLSKKLADVALFVATGPHRSDGLSSFAHRAGLQDLGVRRPGLTPLRLQQPLGLTIIIGLVRTHGQVAPVRHPLQADRYDEPFGDLHRRQLAVPRA